MLLYERKKPGLKKARKSPKFSKRHLTKSFPEGHPLQTLKIPGGPYKPNMFMLGSSEGGLSLAAKFGLKFAFAG
nr:hypothetical protein [Paenibacillus xylanexedens]